MFDPKDPDPSKAWCHFEDQNTPAKNRFKPLHWRVQGFLGSSKFQRLALIQLFTMNQCPSKMVIFQTKELKCIYLFLNTQKHPPVKHPKKNRANP